MKYEEYHPGIKKGKYMRSLPCENCITLSMCRAKLNDSTTKELLELADKCSILFHFLYFTNDIKNTPYVEYPNIQPGSPQQMRYNQLEYNITLLGATLLKDIPFHYASGYMKLTLRKGR